MASSTPLTDLIRDKLSNALSPSKLDIDNDSHLHAHHVAMRGYQDEPSHERETHFRLLIVSKEFVGKSQASRHRIVYKLLDDEIKKDGGIHALQIKTRTPEEDAATKVSATRSDGTES